MAAKKDVKKVKGPGIEVVWNGGVPEVTYFERNGYKTVGKVEKGQFTLTWDGWDEDPDTLLKVLGRKFAQKEPHKAHLKIMTSLDRRGVPYKRI